MMLCDEHGVVTIERVDRVADQALGETAHLGDHPHQLLEIGVERLVGVFGHYHVVPPLARQPKRPVM